MNKKNVLVALLFGVGTSMHAQQTEETQIEEVSLVSKTPQNINKVGKNVTLITAADLENYKGQNLNDVLDQVAGIQITGNFNNMTEPKGIRVRGGKSANVLLLLDGVPLRDVSGNDYTASDLRWLALENIESIEVLNGASSVLYGSNATVSVINIVTKSSAKNVVEGLVSARGGSYGTYAQNVVVKGAVNGFNYQVDGFNEKSKGISSAKGDETFDKDGYEKQNVQFKIGYAVDQFQVNAYAGYNHFLYQFDQGAFADSNQRGDDEQTYFGGNAKLNYTKGNLVFNTRFTKTDRLLQDLTKDGYQDQYQYIGKNSFFELYNYYEFSKNASLVAGVQYEKQSLGYKETPWGGTSLEEKLKNKDTDISTFDGYAKANVNYEGFNLDAGVRMTNHSKFKDHWVYSINPYYVGETNSVFYKIGYSFATAFIVPTLYQNYGSIPYILPNFDLKPEKNSTHEIDLSVGSLDKKWQVTASLFQRKEKDGFVYAIVDQANYTGQFVNLDENKAKGFELGFEYQIADFIGLGANYSFVEKENEASMLRIPKHRVNSQVSIKPSKSTSLLLMHQFIGKRNDAYFDSNTYKTVAVENKAYHTFHLNVNQKLTDKLSLFGNVNNIFNENYVDVIGYTTKGRNYTVGFNYQF